MMAVKTRIVSNPEQKELLIERVFDAPRELVFKAWTEPERLKQWWGPRQWPLTECRLDLRVGGMWHYCMTGPDGTEAWGRAIYSEIVVPERLVYTDSFSDAEGKVNASLPTTVVRVEFSEENGKTKVSSYATFASADDLQSLISMGMVEGVKETWDLLEEYLASAS